MLDDHGQSLRLKLRTVDVNQIASHRMKQSSLLHTKLKSPMTACSMWESYLKISRKKKGLQVSASPLFSSMTHGITIQKESSTIFGVLSVNIVYTPYNYGLKFSCFFFSNRWVMKLNKLYFEYFLGWVSGSHWLHSSSSLRSDGQF